MKRIFLLIFISFFAINYSVNAQTFEILKDSVYAKKSSNKFSVDAKTYVVNKKQEPLKLRWIRYDQNFSSKWSTPGFCDNVQCHTDTDTADFKPIAAEDTVLIKGQFFTNREEGNGYLEVFIYDLEDTKDNGEQVEFYAKTEATGVELSNKPKLNFYPNPAKDHLQLEFGYNGEHQVKIFDALGKLKIEKQYQRVQEAKLSLNNLPKGMYVISYQNKEGKVLTKTFTKR